MAPGLRLARSVRVALFAATLVVLAAPPAHALRVVNYNILNYPSMSSVTRDPHFRTVLGPLGADVVVVQEMQSQAGVDQFLTNVLDTLEPGEWAAAPFYNGPDTDNALFYKPSRVTLMGSWAWLPPDNLRFVAVYRLKPVGYESYAAEFRIYSLHLKASNTSTDRQRRLTDAIGIRDSMNAVPYGTHSILAGDFNIYSGAELAFQKFLESQEDTLGQPNNYGRLYDPLNLPFITYNTPSLAPYHTQSPCLSGCPGGFATGGLDDRFDMFLPTYNFNDGTGLELLASTYIPVGNDGLHYDKNITDPPTIPEGAEYATALFSASDHLPIRVDIQLPAKIETPAMLALGTVIVGGGADLAVSNPAVVPADDLDYRFTAPPGFTAPGGAFAVAPGAPAALHLIGTSAGAPGPRAGDLVIESDAPDDTTRLVALSAHVLDHAQPSLDSLSVMTAGVLDFGQHESGSFPVLDARVHNAGYNALQAKLDVTGASITGGGGRFSLPGGFSPAQLAGVGQSWAIAFDDAGATADSVYEATLTFTGEDEALPGATALAALALTLRAELSGGTVAAGAGALPRATVLHAPYPNPVRGAPGTLRFDLAQHADVALEVYDVHGRRLARLAHGAFAPGRYAFQWNGRDARGDALGSGLYFVRLSGDGIATQMRRIAVVH